jgi:hypothetical protein
VIGDRSKHDLTDGEAEQIARQGQLHLRHRGAEHPAELRQGGQIEVDRHRTDRGQQRQQRGQRQSVGTQHRDLLGCGDGNSYARCGMMALCRARDRARLAGCAPTAGARPRLGYLAWDLRARRRPRALVQMSLLLRRWGSP